MKHCYYDNALAKHIYSYFWTMMLFDMYGSSPLHTNWKSRVWHVTWFKYAISLNLFYHGRHKLGVVKCSVKNYLRYTVAIAKYSWFSVPLNHFVDDLNNTNAMVINFTSQCMCNLSQSSLFYKIADC